MVVCYCASGILTSILVCSVLNRTRVCYSATGVLTSIVLCSKDSTRGILISMVVCHFGMYCCASNTSLLISSVECSHSIRGILISMVVCSLGVYRYL